MNIKRAQIYDIREAVVIIVEFSFLQIQAHEMLHSLDVKLILKICGLYTFSQVWRGWRMSVPV
jgi:hypothetical protein